MLVGKLRHRVTLQAHSDPDAVTGDDWVNVGRPFPALVLEKVLTRNREGFNADAVHSPAIYEVTSRWREGVTIAHRLLWRDKILNITNVFDDGGVKAKLLMVCVEGMNNG